MLQRRRPSNKTDIFGEDDVMSSVEELYDQYDPEVDITGTTPNGNGEPYKNKKLKSIEKPNNNAMRLSIDTDSTVRSRYSRGSSIASNSKFANSLPPTKPPPLGMKPVLSAKQRLERTLPPTPSPSNKGSYLM